MPWRDAVPRLTELQRQSDAAAGLAVAAAEAKYDWGTGAVQKQEVVDEAAALAAAAAAPFARWVGPSCPSSGPRVCAFALAHASLHAPRRF